MNARLLLLCPILPAIYFFSEPEHIHCSNIEDTLVQENGQESGAGVGCCIMSEPAISANLGIPVRYRS